MKRFIVLRREYDKLVRYREAWMRTHWGKYDTQWTIVGVEVTAEEWQIDSLKVQISMLEKQR